MISFKTTFIQFAITFLFLLASIKQGSSQFGEEHILDIGLDLKASISGDLNQDGFLDLICYGGGLIVWYENDGQGNFGEQQSILSNSYIEYFSVEDLDEDGDLDLLISYSIVGNSTSGIKWYENDGTGNFVWKQNIWYIWHNSIVVYDTVDIDGDGDLDVISASAAQNFGMVWHENDGTGNFSQAQIVSVSSSIQTVFATDVDGDGDMDVLSGYYDDKVAWHQNDGAGNFGEEQIITTNADGVNFVISTDVDEDGDMDVLSASQNDDKIAWYQNDGVGNFGTQQIININQPNVTSLFTTDIDGDGDEDLMAVSYSYSEENKISWYQNDGNGNFSEELIVAIVDYVELAHAADWDADGDMDIISSSNDSSETIICYKNDGNGNFDEQQLVDLTEADAPYNVLAVDLDGDGDNDVVAVTLGDYKLVTYQNDGLGNFGEIQIITTDPIGISKVLAEDVDGDGDVDLITASENGTQTTWHENDGQGNFGEHHIIASYTEGNLIIYMTDMDGDGIIDLLVTSYGDNTFAWYQNDGQGNFGDPQFVPDYPGFASSAIASDLNGDGRADVIVIHHGSVSWFSNNVNGTFGSEQEFASFGNATWSVYTVDIDGDGDMDVFTTVYKYGGYQSYHRIAWHENDGNGNFAEAQSISTEISVPIEIKSADIDGDGDIDIMVRRASSLEWFENDGDVNFGTAQSISSVSSFFPTDMDEDGDIDILSSAVNNKISWYENAFNEGCMDETACNYSELFVVDDGSCCYENCGCTDENADNYDETVSCDDNSCIILGCIDNTACSFDFYANVDDGSCGYPGCMDSNASNYDSTAFCDDESCLYYGCTDELACNYNSFSITDDGSCLYPNGCADSEAFNYDSSANCDDGSCVYEGCTNTDACNFDYNADINDGSCILPNGCVDPNADNYDSSATCDDSSCNYKIEGLVFYDENENGIFDGLDYGLPFQEITSSDDLIYLTNDEGIFYSDATSESITFTLSSNESFPFNTTDNPQTIVNGINTSTNDFSLDFGISSEFPYFAICLDFYPSGSGYPCDDWVNHNLCYRNMGNVPINGILEVEYDTLFQDYQEVTPIDSVVGNIIYMSFDNLMPGQMYFYDVSFHTPNFESIGEFLTSTGRVYGFYEGQEVAYGESILVHEMTCSYDPNDKQVFPSGYADPHYVLPETRLEYLVRFQNTGNAPATNVLVTDTIDPTLDLSSFELVANSHSVITTIKTEERVIEFLFENIMLPDSMVNEPESHGLISYKLTPLNELDYETEINNTAYIYFDNNPAIVTNTTWTTIYDCNDGLASFDISDSEICLGEEISLENTQEYVEDYLWFVDNELTSSEQIFSTNFENSTEYSILLEVNNPLCNAVDSTTIIVNSNPLPEINLTEDLNICLGESTVLTATGGETYNWNGQGTEAELEITPTETATYEVTATNEFDCSVTDNVEVTVNSFPEITVSDDVTLCEGESTVLTATGGETYDWNGQGTEPELEVTPIETTFYEVTATNEFDCSSADSVEVIVNPLPIITLSNDVTICEDESTILTVTGGGSYDWNGEGTDPNLEVTPDETTTYEVTATNEFDCSSTAEVTVFINPLPTVEITADQITLTALAAETYQWYLNGNPIDGANSQTYVAQENGNYSVEVTNEYNCTSISNEIIISVVGIEELSGQNIQIFPNPMQESSMLYFGESGVDYQVKLFTIEGKLIRDYGQVTSGQLEIKRKGLSTGNYLVEVIDATIQKKFTMKLSIK